MATIESFINARITGSISVESMTLSPVMGRLTLKNAMMKDPDGIPCAGFEGFTTNISWFGLLKNTVLLKTVEIDKPWLNVIQHENGTMSVIKALAKVPYAKKTSNLQAPSPKTTDIPKIIIQSLHIDHGASQLTIPHKNLSIAVNNIECDASGNLASKSGKLTLTIQESTFSHNNIQESLGPFHLKMNLSNDTIDSFSFALNDNAAHLKGSGKISNIFTKPSIDMVLDAKTALTKFLHESDISRILDGNIMANLKVNGFFESPHAVLTIDYRNNHSKAIFDSIHACLSLDDRLVTLREASANIAEGTIRAQGKVNLERAFPAGFLSPQKDMSAASYDLAVSLEDISFKKLKLKRGDIQGTALATLSMTGQGLSTENAQGTISFDATVNNFTTSGYDIKPVSFSIQSNASFRQKNITLAQLNIMADDLSFSAKGQTNLNTYFINGKLTLESHNLKKLFQPLGISNIAGKAAATGTFTGTLKKPEVSIRAHGEQISYGKTRVGTIILSADIDDSGILSMHNLTVSQKNSMLHASGSLALIEPSTLSFNNDPAFSCILESDHLAIEDFRNDGKGTFLIKSHLEGTFSNPCGSLMVRGSDIQVNDQLINSFNVSAEVAGGKIHLKPLKITIAPQETLICKGWLSMNKAYSLTLQSQGILLKNIAMIKKQNFAQGLLSFNIQSKGTFADPDLQGTVSLSDITINDKKANDITLNVNTHDSLIRAYGTLNFDLKGNFHSKTRNFSASAIFSNTDLSPYFKLAGQKDITGTASGTITAQGNTKRLNELKVDCSFSEIDLQYKETKIAYTEKFNMSLSNGVLILPECRFTLPEGGHAKAEGKGKLTDKVLFTAQGSVPFRIFAPILDDVGNDLTGKISFSARLTGNLHDPAMEGSIELDTVGLTLSPIQKKIHNFKGTIYLTPQNVMFDKVTGNIDAGSCLLNGSIGLEKLRPVKVSANILATGIPLSIPDTADMTLNGDIKVTGNRSQALISGTITILEGLYYKDVAINLLQKIGEKKRTEKPLPKESKNPFLKNMNLDILVNSRTLFLVDNNLAHLEISPELRITGKTYNPVIRGRATVQSGTISYQKKTFVIEKGIIDFLNPYITEPTFDIESEIQLRHWLISLAVSGTPDNLSFKLTSNPPEEHEDILSLLVFGKTSQELIEEEGGTGRSAEQMLAEFIGATYGKNIKQATGLDIFEVEASNNNYDKGIKVTLGKELSKRMTVKYSAETSEGEVLQRTTAEYKILENFLVGAFQDSRGSYGGEFQFRLEFR